MPAKLYAVPASHPCATVERALQLKDVPYRRIDLVPPMHKAFQRPRFGGGTVPGIVFEDGRKVLGSREIIRVLEADRPEPPLLPPEGEHRQRVEAAEEWGDQVLQPLVRRLLWHALSAAPAAQLSYLDGAHLFPPTPRALARLSGRGVAWAERRINASNEPAVRADLTHLPGHLDRIDRWIAAGTLCADRPNAADLQIGASVRLLLTLEDLVPLIEPRPAATLARRWFAAYPGSVPRGTFNPAWLPDPRAAAGQPA